MSEPHEEDRAEPSIFRSLVFNQYQAILLLGVGAVSFIAASPLPLLFWGGAQLVLLPLLDSGPLRRLLARRRNRRQQRGLEASRSQAVAALERNFAARYQAMQSLCALIEGNYRQLNGLSQAYLYEQRGKLDVILDGCLHRLLALQRYATMLDQRSEGDVMRQMEALRRELQQEDLPERARAAIGKNIELKNRLLESLREARGTMKALATELDSMQSLLEVLHQNSIAMQDPQAVSQELDAIARQSEDSGRVVREMEALVRAGEMEGMQVSQFPVGDPPKSAPGGEVPSRRSRERRR
jgi:hypothetical protein